MNILVGFLGVTVGWVVGIVLVPFTVSEGQRFAIWGAALSAFVTGYVAGKVDGLVRYVFDPTNLTTHGEFLGVVFIVTFLMSLIVVFESRFGVNPADW